jgi:thiol-disulfide isomerase/thioredoxin
MVFMSIDEKDEELLSKFDSFLKNKKVFVLIYMEGCGPCNATRPEWGKLKNVLPKFKNSDDVAIVDINTKFISELKNIGILPESFPTIRFYNNSKNGKFTNFEDSNIEDSSESKEREVDSFVDWINTSLKNSESNKVGGRKRTRKTNKRSGWTKKYKKSINCKRPKGFSQKQYCKYGRKK